jgi:anti-sigma B factor antagonist
MNCTAAVRKIGDVAIVDLSGQFTIEKAPGLIRRTVADVLESGTRNILMNLAQVTYMDSAAGIGELVGSYSSAVRRGARLKLLHASKNVYHVLQITRLNTIFEIYIDEDAAIRSFRELSTEPTWRISEFWRPRRSRGHNRSIKHRGSVLFLFGERDWIKAVLSKEEFEALDEARKKLYAEQNGVFVYAGEIEDVADLKMSSGLTHRRYCAS